MVFFLSFVAAVGRVAEAEGAVAAEGEEAGGFGGEGVGVREDHGGNARIGEAVEVFADGVEGDEVRDGEVADCFEDEFGEVEELIEDSAGSWG